MAIVIKPITVEVSKPNLFQAIAAKQDDSNSRFLKVTFVNEGETIPVLTTSKVTINAKRSDGQANSFFGEVNDDGTATVPLHSWMLELPGIVNCDTSILDSEDRKLTSTTFNLLVEEAAYSDGDISDDPQSDVLNTLIDYVKSLEGGTLDDELSETSEGAVKNKAITAALNTKATTTEVAENFASAIKNTSSGSAIKLTDISTIEHTLGLKVGGITQKCVSLVDIPDFSNTSYSAEIYAETYHLNDLPKNIPLKMTYKVKTNGEIVSENTGKLVYIYYTDGVTDASYDGTFTLDGTKTLSRFGVYGGSGATEQMFYDILIAKSTDHFEGLRSSPATEVERWGENISKPSNTESWGVATAFESDGKVVLTTTTAYSSQYARVATATLKKDTPYIVSVVSPNNVKSVRVWKTGTYEDLSSTGSITHTFTLNEDTSVDIAIYAIDNSPVGTVTSGYVVLVQGTTDTHQTFTVPETVQALEGYGDGINETSYNYVDFEKKQFVKRCKRYVLNGNSDEGWYENTNGQFITGINVYGAKPNSEALCNLYKYDKTETPINTFFVGSAGIAFNTIFETTEEWKAYLAELYALGNPLTILCELATPEITDISNLLTNAKTLTSIYPETNLYTDNENGYLDVTYNADTKKYIDNKFAELQALILNS